MLLQSLAEPGRGGPLDVERKIGPQMTRRTERDQVFIADIALIMYVTRRAIRLRHTFVMHRERAPVGIERLSRTAALPPAVLAVPIGGILDPQRDLFPVIGVT